MGDIISRFEKGIQRINIIYGLLLPLLVSVIFSAMLWFIRPGFFQTGELAKITYVIVVVIILAVALVQTISRGSLSQLQKAFIYVLYHIGLGLLTLFVVPHQSPFAFMWLVLLIAVDLLFGKKWQRVTIGYYLFIQIVSFIHASVPVSAESIVVGLTYVVGTLVVAIQASKYRQISDQERSFISSASKETTFERQRLVSLINNMGEAVIATDKRGRVLVYNAAVLDLLDTNQSLEGKSLDSILRLKDSKHKKVKPSYLIEQNPAGLTSKDYTHEFSSDDIINIYLNVAPVRLGFKEEIDSGYILLMRDITKEKSLEDERDEFISVVSHELRTPVAIAEGTISNAMLMNEKGHGTKQISESLDQAHDQVLFLASMINDLATLSRAERTDVKLEITEIDPRTIVHEMGEEYEPQAQRNKLKLTVSAAKNTKPIKTSELYLREILQNFITNALKYTKKGSVILHVRSSEAGDAVFSVSDTGIGLSKADQKKIFQKFFRSEDYRTRESNGTGLGLYVTTKLAHKLKAQIHFESELNKGSTFTISVPSLETNKKHLHSKN